MKTAKTKKTQRKATLTLLEEFGAGVDADNHPNKAKDKSAVRAVASKSTSAKSRAYWSGYLCQRQLDGDLIGKI